MAYADLLASKLNDLSTTAGDAVADLAGVQSGADVLASQFTDVKNALQDLQDFVNEFKSNYYYTPVGLIAPFGGASAEVPPSGWFLCDGSEKSISSFPSLYAILTAGASAYPYGANTNGSGGAGSSHFRLPDLRGRTTIGVGTGVEVTATIGTVKGAATKTLATTNLPTHTHSWSTTGGAHGHTYYRAFNANEQIPGSGAASYTVDASSRGYGGVITLNVGGDGSHSHSGTTGDGTGTFNATPIDMLQPSLPVSYIIKY